MLVVADASVLVTLLTEFNEIGKGLAAWLTRLSGDDPELFTIANFTQLEVISAVSRQVKSGQLEETAADRAIVMFQQLPTQRKQLTLPVARRILELRNNFSAYDAAYLAVAEALQSETKRSDVVLATIDSRLANAPTNLHLAQVELFEVV